jgi:type IV pilus assembly protein PilM
VAKQVVGLKIGASSLSAACVEQNGFVRLLQVARAPLPPGIVAGGEVRDPEALAQALKNFFKQHKLPRRNVRVGVGNNRIGVRTIELSGIEDPKQLANAVRFRAQEALPIPVDQAVLDFQVLSEDVDEEGVARKRILLVVAYRELVDGYARACRLAGIRLTGIDLEAFALLRALTPSAPVGEERSALVAVAVGADRSILAVSDGFACEFTRVLEWGGNSLSIALARVLGGDVAEAEAVKRRLSLGGSEVPEGLTEETAAQARDAMRASLQNFARELVSSLLFYQRPPDSLGIRELALAGGTAQLGGMAAALEVLVGVPVRVADPLAAVGTARKINGGLPDPSLIVPIGLGMAQV